MKYILLFSLFFSNHISTSDTETDTDLLLQKDPDRPNTTRSRSTPLLTASLGHAAALSSVQLMQASIEDLKQELSKQPKKNISKKKKKRTKHQSQPKSVDSSKPHCSIACSPCFSCELNCLIS